MIHWLVGSIAAWTADDLRRLAHLIWTIFHVLPTLGIPLNDRDTQSIRSAAWTEDVGETHTRINDRRSRRQRASEC